ncbi:MAG: toll/interleukin-1 receptor domain-containing protein [Bacteroidetes bacterium]|nr:toll/interleukin-1 receptor domain-containing protein [Bacteroidota bacterium]
MKRLPSIFISYNPDSDFEQVLAVRLHTLGGVNGYHIMLPDRFASGNELSSETKFRIGQADFFVLFSTGKISKAVQQEIEYAFQHYHDKSRIIVIYDKSQGKNLSGADQCTQVFIDRKKELNESVKAILSTITNPSPKSVPREKENALGILLLLGLGLRVASDSKN